MDQNMQFPEPVRAAFTTRDGLTGAVIGVFSALVVLAIPLWSIASSYSRLEVTVENAVKNQQAMDGRLEAARVSLEGRLEIARTNRERLEAQVEGMVAEQARRTEDVRSIPHMAYRIGQLETIVRELGVGKLSETLSALTIESGHIRRTVDDHSTAFGQLERRLNRIETQVSTLAPRAAGPNFMDGGEVAP